MFWPEANTFIFTIDKFLITVDFLNFVGLPPLESLLIKTPFMDIDSIENKEMIKNI